MPDNDGGKSPWANRLKNPSTPVAGIGLTMTVVDNRPRLREDDDGGDNDKKDLCKDLC